MPKAHQLVLVNRRVNTCRCKYTCIYYDYLIYVDVYNEIFIMTCKAVYEILNFKLDFFPCLYPPQNESVL